MPASRITAALRSRTMSNDSSVISLRIGLNVEIFRRGFLDQRDEQLMDVLRFVVLQVGLLEVRLENSPIRGEITEEGFLDQPDERFMGVFRFVRITSRIL